MYAHSLARPLHRILMSLGMSNLHMALGEEAGSSYSCQLLYYWYASQDCSVVAITSLCGDKRMDSSVNNMLIFQTPGCFALNDHLRNIGCCIMAWHLFFRALFLIDFMFYLDIFQICNMIKGMSRMSLILLLSYRGDKLYNVLHCLEIQRFTHISGTRFQIVIRFRSKCLILWHVTHFPKQNQSEVGNIDFEI